MESFHMWFVDDKQRGMYRVGRSDRPTDQFDFLTLEEFEKVQAACKFLRISLVDKTDEA